jgi:predicted nucleotide-binding protein (sugar kinase/HSP70/actin superfamily)
MQENDYEKMVKKLCEGLHKFLVKNNIEVGELKFFKQDFADSRVVCQFMLAYIKPEIIIKDIDIVDAYMRYCVYGEINDAKPSKTKKLFIELLQDQVPCSIEFDEKLYEKAYDNPKQSYSDENLMTI